MRKLLLLLFPILFSTFTLTAQNLEEDNLVLYAKANILFESGRYDEAIRMYNRILKNDENHTAALLMRAKTKYELGAYKGTKMDVLIFIEKIGINKEVIQLMSKTEVQLSNETAAINYIQTALELDSFDDELLLISGDIYLKLGNRNEACEQFQKAAQLDNYKAQGKLSEYCLGRNIHQDKESVDPKPSENQDSTDEVFTDDEPSNDDGIVSLEDIVQEAEKANPSDSNADNQPSTPNIDRTQRNEIEIDDKLTVVFAEGIGHREVQSQPSIFMLSDQDGTVVFDVCIDAEGKVTEAIFNRDESTIFRSSLTSLALRKARSFVFSPSRSPEQCGLMVFQIRR